MSAIWGYLSYLNPVNTELADLMEAPYKEKCNIDRYRNLQHSTLFMGCGIQHITKEAKTEILPVFDVPNGIFFTSDCLLDNREELTLQLNTDSEQPDGTLMFLAYKKWGIDCLRKFRGLFSMAVYDKKQNTLYLATDQTSSRCLYYYKTKDFVCFSTLLEPIRRICPDIPLNEYYIKDFLTAPGLLPNIVPTETPYIGVYKINPGCYVAITQDTVTEHSYWTPFMQKKHRHLTAKGYGKAFRTLFSRCVTDALRTDGEVGISMSSGLDSASIGALAATSLRTKNKSLFTYTYVPYEIPKEDNNKFLIHNETEDVMKITRMYPNMLPHFLNNHGANCLEFLNEGIKIMEIPFKAFVNLPNLYEIYVQAKKDNCKIVLTGQAGNGTISHGYINDILFDDYQKGHFLRFFNNINRYAVTVKISRKKMIKTCLRRYSRAKKEYRCQNLNSFTPDNPYLTRDVLSGYPLRERYHTGEIYSVESLPMNKEGHLQFLFKKALYTYLGELDTKLGLATGVVLRDPSRDSRILEFCASLPYHIYAYRGTPRWLIRGALADYLPADLLNDWIRHGIQNSDWLLRIKRDRQKIFPALDTLLGPAEKTTGTFCLHSVINTQKIKQLLSSMSADDLNVIDEDFHYAVFLAVISAFLEQYN